MKRPEAGGAAHVAIRNTGAGGSSLARVTLFDRSLSHSLWKDPLGTQP